MGMEERHLETLCGYFGPDPAGQSEVNRRELRRQFTSVPRAYYKRRSVALEKLAWDEVVSMPNAVQELVRATIGIMKAHLPGHQAMPAHERLVEQVAMMAAAAGNRGPVVG